MRAWTWRTWRGCGAVLLALVLAGCGVVGAGERVPVGKMTPAPDDDGWQDLFTDAAAWENVSDGVPAAEVFTLEDGVFHIKGQKPTRYLAYTPETYGDFELHIEFKLTEGANSGVFFRTDPDNVVQGGFELQVLDSYGEPPSKQGCGSLYDVATPMFQMVMPPGEWNSYDLRVEGSEVEAFLNGWRVLHLDLSKMTEPIGKFDTPLARLPQTGHIILQDHGDEVWYRNLLVRPL